MKKCAFVTVLLVVLAASAFAGGHHEVQAATKSAPGSAADQATDAKLLTGYTGYLAAAKEVQAETRSASGLAADQAAIAQLWTDYSDYVVAANVDGFLSLHTRDAYKMPQDEPMFQLWAAADEVRAAWVKRKESAITQMHIDPKETVIMGEYAYSMGTYYLAVTPNDGSKPSITDGKFLTVLQKDTDGNWKILRDCYNNNTPAGR